MQYLYGPVISRRIGSSLGVDLFARKTCSLSCVYCQLGPTPQPTLERAEYVDIEPVFQEISDYLSGSGQKPDYITFSGSGEPTLHSRLGELIRRIKHHTDTKVALITNSTLLTLPEVRADVSDADLVVPSLDAGTQEVFERINRPAAGLKVGGIIEGLVALRKEFAGELRLEMLFVKGLNDTEAELEALREAARKIAPDVIDVNTVARPPAEEDVVGLSEEKLAGIASFLGPEARVVTVAPKSHTGVPGEAAQRILGLLRRRPCSFSEICSSLGLEEGEARAALDALLRKGYISRTDSPAPDFYQAR